MDVIFPQMQYPAMDTPLKKRVRARMDAMSLNATQTARKAGLGESFVRDILRGKTRSPSAANLEKLATALETSADNLMGRSVEADQVVEVPVTHLAVISDVQAGSWMEVTVLEEYEHETIPVARDPRFPNARQYALRVRGDSMNEIYPEGDFVTCVDYWDSGVPIKDGLHVHVERQKAGGQLVEITIKVIESREGQQFLVPRSTNSKWQAIPIEGHTEGEEEVFVKGIVTGSWRPTPI